MRAAGSVGLSSTCPVRGHVRACSYKIRSDAGGIAVDDTIQSSAEPSPGRAHSPWEADHRIRLVSMCLSASYLFMETAFFFLFFPSSPSLSSLASSSFHLSSPCFFLSSFSVFDFVRTDAVLGVFLSWDSFAGCLRGIQGLRFSPATPTFGEEPLLGGHLASEECG